MTTPPKQYLIPITITLPPGRIVRFPEAFRAMMEHKADELVRYTFGREATTHAAGLIECGPESGHDAPQAERV